MSWHVASSVDKPYWERFSMTLASRSITSRTTRGRSKPPRVHRPLLRRADGDLGQRIR